MEYERPRRDVLRTRVPIGKTVDSLILQATDIRKASTGTHARITIALNPGGRTEADILEEDTFNIGRREERNRLASAAHKAMNGHGQFIDVADLQHELLLFCRNLWDEHMGTAGIEVRRGHHDRSKPSWVLEPFILEKAGTILFAPPGRGKSWTALLWAIAVDAGVSTFWPVKQCPVLYINLERAPMDARQGDVNAVLGLSRDRELAFLNRRGSSLAAVAELVSRHVEREGTGLVVLDSLSRGGLGNMNDNDPANSAMDILNSFGCAWLALGHTPRDDETHAFGSQMFDAAADLMVQMATAETGSALGIGFKVTKANDVPKPKPQQWAYRFDEYGLVKVETASPDEFAELPNWTPLRDRMRVFLAAEGASTATAIATALGVPRTTVASQLKDTSVFVFVRKEGREALYGVLSRSV